MEFHNLWKCQCNVKYCNACPDLFYNYWIEPDMGSKNYISFDLFSGAAWDIPNIPKADW